MGEDRPRAVSCYCGHLFEWHGFHGGVCVAYKNGKSCGCPGFSLSSTAQASRIAELEAWVVTLTKERDELGAKLSRQKQFHHEKYEHAKTQRDYDMMCDACEEAEASLAASEAESKRLRDTLWQMVIRLRALRNKLPNEDPLAIGSYSDNADVHESEKFEIGVEIERIAALSKPEAT